MLYAWDPNKAASNFRKHGVHFADAVTVFSDQAALTIEDDYPTEERFIVICTDALGRVLVVAFTWRGEKIRIISARKAASYERAQYEGQT